MDYSVGILAGGGSRRFTSDKRLALYEGRTFLSHALMRFSYSRQTVLSMGFDDEDPSVAGVCVVRDRMPGFGPMEGICRILECADSHFVFILPVDMPLVDRSVADYLFSFVDSEHDIVCPSVSGRVFPLCAFYSRSVLPVAEDLVSKDVHKLMALLDSVRTRIVEMPCQRFPERLFLNVNDLGDYRRLSSH